MMVMMMVVMVVMVMVMTKDNGDEGYRWKLINLKNSDSYEHEHVHDADDDKCAIFVCNLDEMFVPALKTHLLTENTYGKATSDSVNVTQIHTSCVVLHLWQQVSCFVSYQFYTYMLGSARLKRFKHLLVIRGVDTFACKSWNKSLCREKVDRPY